jgi:predicted transcriptional regulator
MSERQSAGTLEQEILSVLVTEGVAMTPATVLAQLPRPLAYTTVMTALSRMHAKGMVNRDRAGRAYAYRSADPATVTARQMRRLLERDSNRAGVLARFVAELDPADETLLEKLLADPGDDGR